MIIVSGVLAWLMTSLPTPAEEWVISSVDRGTGSHVSGLSIDVVSVHARNDKGQNPMAGFTAIYDSLIVNLVQTANYERKGLYFVNLEDDHLHLTLIPGPEFGIWAYENFKHDPLAVWPDYYSPYKSGLDFTHNFATFDSYKPEGLSEHGGIISRTIISAVDDIIKDHYKGLNPRGKRPILTSFVLKPPSKMVEIADRVATSLWASGKYNAPKSRWKYTLLAIFFFESTYDFNARNSDGFRGIFQYSPRVLRELEDTLSMKYREGDVDNEVAFMTLYCKNQLSRMLNVWGREIKPQKMLTDPRAYELFQSADALSFDRDPVFWLLHGHRLSLDSSAYRSVPIEVFEDYKFDLHKRIILAFYIMDANT